jgi:hypothetical protein
MNKTQKGFAVLEGLLLLVVVGMVSGTGWYAIHTKHQTDKILSQSEKTSQTVPSPSRAGATQKYIVISKWGVKGLYDGNLHIKANPEIVDSAGVHYVGFSSMELDASDPLCKSTGNYGGIITRYAASEHYLVGDGELDSGQTAAEYAKALDKSTYGHVDNYYYFYEHSQAACGQSQSSNDIQGQTSDAVKSLIGSLKPV